MIKEAIRPTISSELYPLLNTDQLSKLALISEWFRKMEEEDLFFQELTPDQINKIVPDLENLTNGKTMMPTQALNELVKTCNISPDILKALSRFFWRAILSKVKEIVRTKVPPAARFGVCQDATDLLSTAVVLELLKPSEYEDTCGNVFAFYEAGAVSFGFKKVKINGDTMSPWRFVVHYAIKHEGEPRLACLVLPLDQEIHFTHRWSESCKKIIPRVHPREIFEINED
ncbi:MAG: hypothetical protein Q8Q15_02525 [bacterium]|nr:hypothetical protein [bacterium]